MTASGPFSIASSHCCKYPVEPGHFSDFSQVSTHFFMSANSNGFLLNRVAKCRCMANERVSIFE
ncbi:hypothetical protein CNY67_13075 [Desulfovibrio sp. G11]|nr:hypothetical protein CNY67_13075 [Desulfovibrio sp. G11]